MRSAHWQSPSLESLLIQQRQLFEDKDLNAVVIAKGRQTGLSTLSSIYIAWKMCTVPGFTACWLSMSLRDSSKVAASTRDILLHLENENYIRLATNSLLSLKVVGGGECVYRPSSPDSTRGLTLDFYLHDEVGFVKNAQEIYNAGSPTLSTTNGKAVFISTPNSQADFFYDCLKKSSPEDPQTIARKMVAKEIEPYQVFKDEDTQWSSCYIHWSANPKCRQIDEENPDIGFVGYMRKMLNLDSDTASREFNLSFDNSSDTFFTVDQVNKLTDTNITSISSDSLQYFGLDCSAHKGGDYTVLMVISQEFNPTTNETTFVIHDSYRSNSGTIEQGIYDINQKINEYGDSAFSLTIETNSMGVAFYEELQRISNCSMIEGQYTGKKNKEEMLSLVKLLIETDRLKLLPTMKLGKTLIKELLNFDLSGNTSRVHDDMVIALVQRGRSSAPGKGRKI